MKLLITIALAAICPAAELPASADAHVSTNLPANNFGGAPQLAIGAGSQALIQFDISGLPIPTDPNTVAKATLVVFVNRVAQAGRIDAAPISSPWSEPTVSGALIPITGATIATSNDIAQANQSVRIDVTHQVKSWIASPFQAFGLALRASAATPAASFLLDSKENTATSRPAYIEIVFQGLAGPAGPTGPQGITGLRGPTGFTGAAGTVGPAGPAGPTGAAGTAGLLGAYGTSVVSGDYTGWFSFNCGSNSTAIGGSCGHRDANSASKDIHVNFVGTDFTDPGKFLCYFRNESSSSRTIRYGVLCMPGRVPVLTASFGEPGAEKEPIGPPPNVEVKTIQLPNGITIERRMVLSKALE